MKALISLFTLLLISTHVSAESAVLACDIITFSSDKKKCYANLKGSYISENAISTCKKASFGSDQVKCLNVSKDKNISKNEAAICAKESFASDIIECMKSAGTTSGRVSIPTHTEQRRKPVQNMSDSKRFEKIRGLARAITRQINNGELQSAKANLGLIQDLTEGRSGKLKIPNLPGRIQIPN